MILNEEDLVTGQTYELIVKSEINKLFNYDDLTSGSTLYTEFRRFLDAVIESGEVSELVSKESMTYKICELLTSSYSDETLSEYGFNFTWEQVKYATRNRAVIIIPANKYTISIKDAAETEAQNFESNNITYNNVNCIMYYDTDGVNRIRPVEDPDYYAKYKITCNLITE